MRAYLAIILILLSGCATRRGSWPADVDPYVKAYRNISKAAGRYSDRVEQVYIRMVDEIDPNSSAVGQCVESDNYIRIKRSAWEQYDGYERQALILHELGHCVHFLPHRTGLGENGWPLSIMYPYVLYSYVYSSRYAYYNRELLTTVDK